MSLASLRTLTKDRSLVWLLALGLAIRLWLLWATADRPAAIVDEQHYLTLAGNLVDGKGFVSEFGPTSIRPPLFPALVAVVWGVTGTRGLVAIRALHLLMGLVTAAVVWRLGREVFDERVGRAAALLVWLYPPLILYGVLLLTETLFTLLVSASLLGAAIVLRTGTLKAAAVTGALVGLAALTRSVLWPFPLVLATLTLALGRSGWRQRLVAAVVVVAAHAIVLAPWAIRNSRLQGVPVLVDTMGGLNLHMGNYEYTPHDRPWDAVSETGSRHWAARLPPQPPGGGAWTEGLKERWARQQAVAFMLSHPGLTARRAAIKFGDFWALDREFLAGIEQGVFRGPRWLMAGTAAMLVGAYPLLLFAFVAGVVLGLSPDRPNHFLLLGTVAFVCALHVVTFAHPRYRLPLTPVLALYASNGVARGFGDGRSRRAVLVTLSICVGFVAIWIAQGVSRDWSQVQRLLAAIGQ